MQFHVVSFKDKVLSDIIPMDFCHMLLDIPWKFDQGESHDGRKQLYTFDKDVFQHTLFPLEEKDAVEDHSPKVLLLSGK